MSYIYNLPGVGTIGKKKKTYIITDQISNIAGWWILRFFNPTQVCTIPLHLVLPRTRLINPIKSLVVRPALKITIYPNYLNVMGARGYLEKTVTEALPNAIIHVIPAIRIVKNVTSAVELCIACPTQRLSFDSDFVLRHTAILVGYFQDCWSFYGRQLSWKVLISPWFIVIEGYPLRIILELRF